MKHYLYVLLAVFLLASCEKTDITNEELRNLVPGGVITTSITNASSETYSLVNETFNTYGCYYKLDTDGTYYFYVRVSGKKHGKIYYFLAKGGLSSSQFEYVSSNPNVSFPVLMEPEVEVEIKDSASLFFTTNHPPIFRVPATMTLSNFGEVGDEVTFTFNFQTSIIPGFSDMAGTVDTRYVIYQY